MPLGERGQPLSIFSDALFFRRPETLVDNQPLLAKLAFIAIVKDYTAVGMRCLDLLSAADLEYRSCSGERTYVRFLIDLSKARAMMPRFPGTNVHGSLPDV